MVEVLAVALTGANFGFEASSFFDAEGRPPGVGQLLIAIDPGAFAGREVVPRPRRARWCARSRATPAPACRARGASRRARRRRREGVTVDATLLAEVRQLGE